MPEKQSTQEDFEKSDSQDSGAATPDVHGLVEEELPPVSTRKWFLIALLVSIASLIPVLVLMLNPPETRNSQQAETQSIPAESSKTE
jgi:hypothetical protein